MGLAVVLLFVVAVGFGRSWGFVDGYSAGRCSQALSEGQARGLPDLPGHEEPEECRAEAPPSWLERRVEQVVDVALDVPNRAAEALRS